MKKVYLIVLALTLASSVFSQAYKPMLKENKVWEVKYMYGGQSSFPDRIDYTLYFLEGDSVIAGNQYYKLHSYETWVNHNTNQGSTTYPLNSNFTGLLLREDTLSQQIFVYSPNYFPLPGTDSTEAVLYDFSASIGDTICAFIQYPNFITTTSGNVYYKNCHKGVVDSIGSTVINTDTVKVQYIRPIDFGVLGELIVIEGSGSNKGFLYPFPIEFEDCSQLICVKDNHTGNYCSNSITNVINQKNNISLFQLYPNPSNGSSEISMKGKELENIQIYNLTGQLIKTVPVNNTKTEINIEDQPQGIYFVKAQFKNGAIATQKLIVN